MLDGLLVGIEDVIERNRAAKQSEFPAFCRPPDLFADEMAR